MIGQLRQELDGMHGSPFLCGLQRANELEQLPVARLHQLRAQLHHDVTALDKVNRGCFCVVNCLCCFALLLHALTSLLLKYCHAGG